MKANRPARPKNTIDHIKEACLKHYKDSLIPGMMCDVLAGEKGSSCSKVTHLPNFKVIHVRFIKDDKYHKHSSGYNSLMNDSRILERPAFKATSLFMMKVIGSLKKNEHSSSTKTVSSVNPKNISVSTMLRMGRVITTAEKPGKLVELNEFNIHKMAWECPKSIEFFGVFAPFLKQPLQKRKNML